MKRNIAITVFTYLTFLLITNPGFSQSVVPYLQTPTDTSIRISWKTDAELETKVFWSSDSLNLNNITTGECQVLSDTGYDSNYFYHSVLITGLAPNTKYFYKVKSGVFSSDTFNFQNQPFAGENSKHFRFLILGDHQVNDRDGYERLMQAAKNKAEEKYGAPINESINLIINNGDQVHEGTLEQYENLHFKKSQLLSPFLPIMTVVGNHETYGSLKLEAYYPHFFYDSISYKGIESPGGENYYSFQTGRVVFVMTSTEHQEQSQLDWVQQIVDSVKVDENVDWVFSVGHRPIQAEQFVGDISVFARDQIIPILTQTKKSVLFVSGHHHLYARGQLRDFPMYHIISGGASWNQYWGQSTEKDFDDVQKTIDYWTYQIVDIDLQKKEMNVECYAIGSPKLGFTLDNILIDSFHRKLDKAIPNTPEIETAIPDTITLPFTFKSSEYSTTTSESLNSTQYQIAKDSLFNDFKTDLIRDFENLYGTTGEPDYLPVDIHKDVNILEYTLAKNSMPNGKYFIRVRHRDQNTEWSGWSAVKSFSITGSINEPPRVRTDKQFYAPDETIKVNFEFGTGNAKDWIGIYQKGQTPGEVSSVNWSYVSGTSGAVELSVPDNGEYFIVLFSNDGYQELSERISIGVSSIPVLNMTKQALELNEEIEIHFSNAPGISNDWIGIYKLNDTPNSISSSYWEYVSGNTGNITANGLPEGYYYANYFLNDGYSEPGERIYFSIGNQPAEIAVDKISYLPSEEIKISFSNGPGSPNDWIGIFKSSNQSLQEMMIDSIDVSEINTGNISYTDTLNPGEYFVSLFINGSWSTVTDKSRFSVGYPTSINVRGVKHNLKVYPNPNSGSFIIDFPKENPANAEVTLISSTGNKLFHKEYHKTSRDNDIAINISNIKVGIYLLCFKRRRAETLV